MHRGPASDPAWLPQETNEQPRNITLSAKSDCEAINAINNCSQGMAHRAASAELVVVPVYYKSSVSIASVTMAHEYLARRSQPAWTSQRRMNMQTSYANWSGQLKAVLPPERL
jgi:hypothetical protein